MLNQVRDTFQGLRPTLSKAWYNSPAYKAYRFAFYMRYTMPNVLRPSIEGMSEEAQNWASALKRNGVVKIEKEEFQDVAEHLATNYFDVLEQDPGAEPKVELGHPSLFVKRAALTPVIQRAADASGLWSWWISYKDPDLAPLYFDQDVASVIYEYNHRQPYFRNPPVLQTNLYTGDVEPVATYKWHIDRLHQVNWMFLVSDVTEEHTHMEYAMGSHIKPIWKDPFHPTQEEIADSVDPEYGHPICKLTGKKGTLYLFDSWGIHRCHFKPKTKRRMMHLISTSGHNIRTQESFDRLDDWPELQQHPAYVRKMMNKIGH